MGYNKKNYLSKTVNIMKRYQKLMEQLKKADERYKRAKEIEDLNRKHGEINKQIRDKSKVILNDLNNKDEINETYQNELDILGKQQEEIHQKLVDKIKGD